jgi:predicted nucleic acid-binding protein
MNLVDSSGWLEFFTNGPNAGEFQAPLSDTASLLVPTVIMHEVFKVVLRERGETAALHAAAAMYGGAVIELTAPLALSAARLGLQLGLSMAESIILATAQAHGAVFWTQDAHFRGLPGVKYFAAGS